MMSLSPELIGIIASAIALGVLMVTLCISIKADHNEFRAEAAADRRAFQAAFQAGMDEFRREVLRISERQSPPLAGIQKAHASSA